MVYEVLVVGVAAAGAVDPELETDWVTELPAGPPLAITLVR
jgi:hypothetical protein